MRKTMFSASDNSSDWRGDYRPGMMYRLWDVCHRMSGECRKTPTKTGCRNCRPSSGLNSLGTGAFTQSGVNRIKLSGLFQTRSPEPLKIPLSGLFQTRSPEPLKIPFIRGKCEERTTPSWQHSANADEKSPGDAF